MTSRTSLFRSTFPQVLRYALLAELRAELAECRTCLDIGCGSGSPMSLLGFERLEGVEAHLPSLEEARAAGTHHALHHARAEDIGSLFQAGTFDCVVAMDLIEHLTRDAGLLLIEAMTAIARRKIVLFTPNGFLGQQSEEGDLQEHLSGWSAEELQAAGFRVSGQLGWRGLRGGKHEQRIRPRALGGLLSAFSHLVWTRRHPRSAAALLCIRP